MPKKQKIFDEELFLDLAREMGIEVEEGPGPDIVNGEEVDVMDLLFNEDHGFFSVGPYPQKPPKKFPEDS